MVFVTRTRALAGLSLLVAAGFWSPAFREPFATGFGDWQFFHHMWEAGYVAITRYREWPLWDPYHCGGITIFGNPQSQHMSPLYLLALLAGPTLGSKLFVVVHAWAGFAGMFLLAERRGLQLPAALLASLIWAGSGFFGSHLGTGHCAFAPFYLTPWVVLATGATLADLRAAPLLAALLTLVLLEGGVYPFPYFVLLVGWQATLQLVAARRAGVRGPQLGRSLISIAAAAGLTGLLGAIRLWPIADELARNPRTMPSGDAISLSEALEMLTARAHSWETSHEFAWSEYGCYVGWGACALALIGCVVALRRGRRDLLLGAALSFGLMLGNHGAWSPWELLHRLPIYDSLRVPSRFCVFFSFYLALLAGLGLQSLSALVARALPMRAAALLGLAITLALGADLAVVQLATVDRWHEPPIVTDAVSPRFYLSKLRHSDHYASFPRMNQGSAKCYEAMNFKPASKLWVGDKPQAALVSGQGSVGPVTRTSSSARLEVALTTPSRVLVNQNYAPGWRTNAGQIVALDGKLAIDLPAGQRKIVLRYRPAQLWPALALSLLGALCALALRLLKRPRAAF